MAKSIISEGKTTNEAIEKGLKQLNVSKKMVDIKVLESEDKRSFFSILAPRVVKVEMTLKEKEEEEPQTKQIKQKKEIVLTEEEQEKAEKNIEKFLEQLKTNLQENISYQIEKSEEAIKVSLNGEGSIAGKGIQNRIRVILDIEGYKEKREKTLEDLAEKVAKTVIKTKKSVKLEPMQAYERKIIHSKLQQNSQVETISIGEEPYRRVVISLKNK